MFRKKLAGWMAIVLTVTTVFTQAGVPVMAAEIAPGQETVQEMTEEVPEEDGDSVSKGSAVAGEEPAPEENEVSEEETGLTPNVTVQTETPSVDGAVGHADDVSETDYGFNLTAEDREAKLAASADVTQVVDAEAGEDYMESEVIVLCDTEEEAEEIAAAYAASTGYTVKVGSFSYGVAVLKMTGSPDRKKLAGRDRNGQRRLRGEFGASWCGGGQRSAGGVSELYPLR